MALEDRFPENYTTGTFQLVQLSYTIVPLKTNYFGYNADTLAQASTYIMPFRSFGIGISLNGAIGPSETSWTGAVLSLIVK